MRGADILVRTLARVGVRRIYSVSGNQIMPIYDACIDAGIEIVHTRHEAAAVFMADATAQLTGQVGVALVTAAPGFANALGALYTARASESPVLLLSGDAPLGHDQKGAFQELSQAHMAAPVTKLSFRASSAAGLAGDVARAVRTALSGRPGPVHLALPFDLVEAEVSGDLPAAHSLRAEPMAASADDIAAIQAALGGAQKPLILTGPSMNATRAGELLPRLAEAVQAPVVPMESPRGTERSVARRFLTRPGEGGSDPLPRQDDRLHLGIRRRRRRCELARGERRGRGTRSGAPQSGCASQALRRGRSARRGDSPGERPGGG